MRIAVATIALNEEKHVERWVDSARDADLLLIADTGSTDGTEPLAEDLGVTVHRLAVGPWRFDVARNSLLSLLPAWDDLVVITLDMDEVLVPGWRNALESSPAADRYTYRYVWSWRDGEPDVSFSADRCHSRFGYQWKHPVHEVLFRTSPSPEVREDGGFEIHHHADDSKPRSQYLPLLEQAARESPHDDRIAHYYARELCFLGYWTASRVEFMRHLALPTAVWAPERAASYRYLADMDDFPERWLLRSVAEAPNRREGWVRLAENYLSRGLAREAAGAAARALQITERTFDYMTDAKSWDDGYLRTFLEV